jgi:hypothetical protein
MLEDLGGAKVDDAGGRAPERLGAIEARHIPRSRHEPRLAEATRPD